MKVSLSFALFCTSFASQVLAWGTLAHRTTTALALLHLTLPGESDWIHDLLNGQEPTLASLYPDRIRYIPGFAYTAPWHYIDAQDSPPDHCSIDFNRDCGEEGCIITALQNHTDRVRDLSLPHWERGQSLRFMLHFFGDLHQPLHTENLMRGGNGIEVVFDGKKTNLHSVWDTLVPDKIAHEATGFEHRTGNETALAYTWAGFLFGRYWGDQRVVEPWWKVCTYDMKDCAIEWATEVNSMVCKVVLERGIEWVTEDGNDLGGAYYEDAVQVVEHMVMKGGRRLGAWLRVIGNEIRDGEAQQTSRIKEQEL